MSYTPETLSDYEKGMLVMSYLKEQKAESAIILDAICDENLGKSYDLITRKPTIDKETFIKTLSIEENQKGEKCKYYLMYCL